MHSSSIDLPDLLARMSHLEHFKKLSRSDLSQIVRTGVIKNYPSGSVIHREGDLCSGLFVLLDGLVYLYKTGPGGQENIMTVIKPVIMFNEVAVLDGGSNPVTAIAAQDCVLWQIDHEGFEALFTRYPSFALGLLRIMAARNRYLISQYEDLSFRPMRSRLAKLLLDLSDNGMQEIDRRLHTISALSGRIVTAPEAVSRTLGEMRKKGYIHSDRFTIHVNQPEALTALAQLDQE